MKYRCPVCGKTLTKSEYEEALRIHEAKEEHLRKLEGELKRRERRLGRSIDEAKREVQERERRRTRRLTAGLRDKARRLEDRIRQLEKGTTPQTDGLEFEEKLAARLKREYPDDGVQHKGKGGDVLHIVRSNGKEAGIIVYECKRVPTIQGKHIHQAYLAKQSREADFAVLVTTGQRRRFSGLEQRDGVLIVAPLAVIPLASLLRLHLIEMLRAKITKERRAIIAQRLLKFITSSQFKNPIEEVVRTASGLEEGLKDEMRDHKRVWERRWRAYQTIRWDATQVQGNLHLVLHGKEPKPVGSPKVAPLLLPAPA